MSLVSAGRRIAFTTVATVACVASMTTVAAAGEPCPVGEPSFPFLAWDDYSQYVLAPAGDVEDAGAAWTLTGGARAVADDPWSGSLSLALRGSATATTPRACVSAAHPAFRFFAKRAGGSEAGELLVDVVADAPGGGERTLRVGAVLPTDQWEPTPVLPTMADVLAPSEGDTAAVRFRFTPVGGGTWSIDDVYVDPVRIR